MASYVKGVKSEDWKYIEECISYLKNKEDEDENILRVERALHRIFDLEFKVIITQNTTNTFYGVNVFPSITHIDKLAYTIINNKAPVDKVVELWQKSDMWYVEIDSYLISDISKPFNSAEIASLIVHEIMRIVYSDVNPSIINNVFRYEYMKLNGEMRALFENDKIRKILNLVIVESCVSKTYNFINEEDNVTGLCYDTICKFGYCDDYNNTVDKIVRYFSSDYINRTRAEVEKDITIVINWAIDNIRQLECSKNKLKTALQTEMLSTNSYICKQYIHYVYKSFFGGVINQYRVLLSEQYMDTPTDVVAEIQAMDNLMSLYNKIVAEASSNIFDKNGKLKKISQLDIDVLTVDSDRIETSDDKIYCLDRLYNMMQTIDSGLEYIESPDKHDKSKVVQSKSTLLDMQKQLARLRDKIVSTRIIEKEYGIYIKYPKGYKR